MKPGIEILPEKKLVGKKMRMTMSHNKTGELWRSFLLGRKEIINNLTNDLFSVQVYDIKMRFVPFDPNKPFDKWAAMEVSDYSSIPEGMEAFTLPNGLYAVFDYKGAASSGADTFRYIFETWVPASGYSIDDRPHFEILGEKYKNEDPDSEEEIWVPVKPER
jgi:AraC family transcriptional regulator